MGEEVDNTSNSSDKHREADVQDDHKVGDQWLGMRGRVLSAAPASCCPH